MITEIVQTTTPVHDLLQHCSYPVDITVKYYTWTLQEGC